jgi:chemotaxis protein MotA
MNVMSIISTAVIIAGILGVAFSVVRGIGIDMLLNVDALIIVLGGTVVATLIGYPLKRIREAMREVVSIFGKKNDREDLIQYILALTIIHRRGGIRDVEDRLDEIADGFLRFGVNLIVNNYKESEIRHVMEREMSLRVVSFNFTLNLLRSIAKVTPALGLAGTVISLIKMFKSIDSVENLMPLMAVALMSTFYGVIISNLFVLPICAKLSERAIYEETLMSMSIDGTLAIYNSENPLKVEERLKRYHEVGSRKIASSAKPFSVAAIAGYHG